MLGPLREPTNYRFSLGHHFDVTARQPRISFLRARPLPSSNMNSKSLVASLLIIALGVAWLLNTLGIVSGVDWIWTMGLAIVGLIVLLIGRFNRHAFVVGV